MGPEAACMLHWYAIHKMHGKKRECVAREITVSTRNIIIPRSRRVAKGGRRLYGHLKDQGRPGVQRLSHHSFIVDHYHVGCSIGPSMRIDPQSAWCRLVLSGKGILSKPPQQLRLLCFVPCFLSLSTVTIQSTGACMMSQARCL